MEDINIYWVTIGVSLIIILSFVYNAIAQKTNIPSVILLIITGFVLGSFVAIDQPTIRPVLEILGTIGLIMIVLEAALDLKLEKENMGLIGKAFLIALILLILTSICIAMVIRFFNDVSIFNALVYAIPLSIMSSAIIIPSVSNLSHIKKEFLICEAAFSDILGIMFFYFVLDSAAMDTAGEITTSIFTNIAITLVISVILGFVIILFMQRIEAQVKLFLPMATLLLLYSVGKLFHLSSLIFVLAFGLMINNVDLFFRGSLKKFIDVTGFDKLLADIKLLTLESSFIVRTFFFIAFGMSITISGLNDITVYLMGLLILIFIYALRFGVMAGLSKEQLKPGVLVAPRGLITILLFFAIPEELAIDSFNSATLLLVIIVSSILMTVGLIKYKGEDEKSAPGGGEQSADASFSGLKQEESQAVSDSFSSGSPGSFPPRSDLSGEE